MRKPSFLYFDLGNVLLRFDHQQACRQMGALAGIAAEKVWDTVFASGLELRYEAGEFDDRGFYDIFCSQTGSQPDFEALLLAGSAIFTPNTSIFPVVGALDAADYRLGILSNTCPAHWAYCRAGRYGLIDRAFDVYALSYELGACKPSPKIFEGAARLAGVPSEEIFFVDDIAGHVAGRASRGVRRRAVHNHAGAGRRTAARGLEFNY